MKNQMLRFLGYFSQRKPYYEIARSTCKTQSSEHWFCFKNSQKWSIHRTKVSRGNIEIANIY